MIVEGTRWDEPRSEDHHEALGRLGPLPDGDLESVRLWLKQRLSARYSHIVRIVFSTQDLNALQERALDEDRHTPLPEARPAVQVASAPVLPSPAAYRDAHH